MALLALDSVTKYYKDTKALSDISLKIKAGEFVSIIGRSGAGKSTLLRCINRMIEPTSGEIHFDGKNVCMQKGRELRSLRTHIGMIFQHYNLVYRQTVLENVLHGRLGFKSTLDGVLGRYTHEEKLKALEIINKLGLESQTYKRCDQLSGGQKQRVGIARALIQDPTLILCDEPIASLDPNSAKIIMKHLRTICDEMKITVLVNLHQVDVALKFSDRVLGIKTGHLVYDDLPENLGKKGIHEIYGTEDGDLIDE